VQVASAPQRPHSSGGELIRNAACKIPSPACIAGNRPHRQSGQPRPRCRLQSLARPAGAPFNENRFHYNGLELDYAGEIGNNGIHGLDLARWLLTSTLQLASAPAAANCFTMTTNKRRIHIGSSIFPTRHWCGASRLVRTGFDGQAFSVVLYGERGTMICDGRVGRIDGIEAGEKHVELNGRTAHFIDCVKQPARQCGIEMA